DYLAVSLGESVEARFRFRTPLGPLQWDLGSLAFPESIFPLSFYDPKSGKLVQRVNLRIESPLRTTLTRKWSREDSSSIWNVRTPSLSASRNGPVIRLDGQHPFIAAGAGIWGLTDRQVPVNEPDG